MLIITKWILYLLGKKIRRIPGITNNEEAKISDIIALNSNFQMLIKKPGNTDINGRIKQTPNKFSISIGDDLGATKSHILLVFSFI